MLERTICRFQRNSGLEKVVKARKSAKTRVGRFGMLVLEVVYSNVILERGFFFQRNPGKGDFEGLQVRAVLRRLWARFSEGERLAQAKA